MTWRKVGKEWHGYHGGVHVATVLSAATGVAVVTVTWSRTFATVAAAKVYAEHMIAIGGAVPMEGA